MVYVRLENNLNYYLTTTLNSAVHSLVRMTTNGVALRRRGRTDGRADLLSIESVLCMRLVSWYGVCSSLRFGAEVACWDGRTGLVQREGQHSSVMTIINLLSWGICDVVSERGYDGLPIPPGCLVRVRVHITSQAITWVTYVVPKLALHKMALA